MPHSERPRNYNASITPNLGANGNPDMSVDGGGPLTGGAERTGRFLVVYRDDALESPAAAMRSLADVSGIKHVMSATDFSESAAAPAEVASGDAYFPELGVAVVSADPTQLQSLMSATADDSNPIIAVEPEYVMRAFTAPVSLDYLRGYHAAVDHLYEQLVRGEAGDAELTADLVFQDNAQFTWGLQATRASSSSRSGRGVSVAVLDTGIDQQHPDFAGRPIVGQGFTNQGIQDGHSHGTHCIGTSCGPQKPPTGVRRYGCAHGANIKVGKVLSNAGGSVGSSVLFGMNWAVQNRFQVISMSLGADVNQVSTAFEQAGRRALQAGCLIVAAAGNNAHRSAGDFGFVGQPANSPSILAVAALDRQLRVANFSARSSALTGDGGKVDIAAPGVDVYSSVPTNRGTHALFNGTSMATPHVAGIAAMWCQATGRTGRDLWTTLVQNVRAIPGDVRDIGAGLVQAPQ